MKFRYRLIFFLIGIAGIIFLIYQMDVKNIPWERFFDTKILLLFLVLFGIWALIYIVHTISYYIILGKEGRKIPFFSLLKICISGFALNSVTPAGLVGGEPYRIMELKRYCSIEKSSSSTLTFSLLYFFGHLLLWLTCGLLYFVYNCDRNLVITIVFGVTLPFNVVLFTLFLLSKKKGLAYPALKFLTKIPLIKKPIKKYLIKHNEQIKEIDDNIKDFRCKGASFWSVLALQYLSRLLECIEYAVILFYFGERFSIVHGILVMGIASLVANLVFIIPLQAGTREGGLYMALAVLDIGESIGSVASIVYRIRDFICIFIGIILILISRKQSGKSLKSTVDFISSGGDNEKAE